MIKFSSELLVAFFSSFTVKILAIWEDFSLVESCCSKIKPLFCLKNFSFCLMSFLLCYIKNRNEIATKRVVNPVVAPTFATYWTKFLNFSMKYGLNSIRTSLEYILNEKYHACLRKKKILR